MRYPPPLIAFILLLVGRPLSDRFASVALRGNLLPVLVLLATIYAFRHRRILFLFLATLGFGIVGLRFGATVAQRADLLVIGHGLGFVMMSVVVVEILTEVLRAKTASTDLVIGAVCLYLVIALAWTFFYYWLYLISPGSIFAAPTPGGPGLTTSLDESKNTELLYFSLSSLTSIGSSGGEPMTTMAQQLAVVEAAMGQLYLAVLVSRLVGFSISSESKT